ncbi:stalk domain-containing protein [Paenibacillus cremeus]|uniref:Copper amine oxidase N-terminal domain-containing protein n=1 Tax=Paenibacillus cremeus TaxID=2163881 RepID=A0A559KHY9_9BACL|nr:stalk domain-containing protein [Paenibacillus cremeus]TVY11736.1 copper amine oxidase N-terminal domain-containing protein [Paenibacillus cremeus]
MLTIRQLFMTVGAAVCALGTLMTAGTALAAVPEHTQILVYPGSTSTYINGVKQESQTAVLERGGRYYLPVSELTAWFGVPVKWQEAKGAVQLTTPSAFLEFTLAAGTLQINGGESRAWDKNVLLQNDRLYVELSWLKQFISYQAKADQELKRVELDYLKSGDSALFHNDAMPNVKPVAKFTVDKDSYRIGEPIHYTDLSYDPKGTELKDINWTGNAGVIFTPGLYKVSLEVKDSLGNVSDTFSRNILVKDEPYLDPFEYKVYYEPVGTYVKEEESDLRKYLRGIPQLKKDESKPTDRPLIVSDSPETFKGKGYLYQEKVNGKARLYADHVNGTDRKMKFAIVVRNPYPDRSVTIKTTNQGEVYPSIYANLIGNEATIGFLQNENAGMSDSMVLGPYESAYYKVMPDFYPGQGMNVLYDVETDGDAYFSFVAMEQGDTLKDIGGYPRLPYSGNVRGTFSVSAVTWDVYASDLTKPSSFAIGDGTSDKFVTGADFLTLEPSLNLGNYGVVYKIHIDKPSKMALLVLPRGGVFKGPFLVNGRIVQTPPSGVMMDYQGYTIIARTDGTEPSLDIDFSPAAGSAFPIDVILYPLNRK